MSGPALLCRYADDALMVFSTDPRATAGTRAEAARALRVLWHHRELGRPRMLSRRSHTSVAVLVEPEVLECGPDVGAIPRHGLAPSAASGPRRPFGATTRSEPLTRRAGWVNAHVRICGSPGCTQGPGPPGTLPGTLPTLPGRAKALAYSRMTRIRGTPSQKRSGSAFMYCLTRSSRDESGTTTTSISWEIGGPPTGPLKNRKASMSR